MDLGLLVNTADDGDEPVVGLVQQLVDELFALPPAEEGSKQIVLLPEAKHVLPRHRPPPVPKPPTKWELFAKSKGIVKRKRDRMVYDENADEYKPRFGKDRAMSDKLPPIMAMKQTDDWDTNPFERAKDEKKLVQLKQKQRELKNRERNAGVSSSSSSSSSSLLARKDKGKGGGMKRNELKEMNEELTEGALAKKKRREASEKKLKFAQVSTASVGRHDVRLRNEPEVERGNKKRKFLPNLPSSSSGDSAASDATKKKKSKTGGEAMSERERNLKLLQRV